MADAIDLTPLKNLQTQGYTGAVIDRLFMEIAGFNVPGIIKGFDIPNLEFETIDTEGGMQTRIPTLVVKPVICNFELLIVIPAVMAVIERAPSLLFRSIKSRLSLVNQRDRYEDGIQAIGVKMKEERVRQEFKSIDSNKIDLTLHTFMHKFGDGSKTYECAFYKCMPPQLRIQMKEYIGGQQDESLIKW